MKQWVNNIEQLREAYSQIADDMREDEKPRSIDVKIATHKRTAEINSVFHIVLRQIRKHLFKTGLGFVEYEDEFTGKQVKMPLDEEVVKNVVKDQLGTKFTFLGSLIAKPTRIYEHDEMIRTLGKIDAWAARELNLQLVYKKRLQAIEEKYNADTT